MKDNLTTTVIKEPEIDWSNYPYKKSFIKKDEVISLLKQGWEIYSKCDEYFGKKGQLVYSARKYTIEDENSGCFIVHHSIIKALQKSGTILNQSPYTYLLR